MCTVSWISSPTGYDLYCNRDEQKTRGPERGPAPFETEGVTCLAPRDGDSGGTWLSVNELGVTVTLLNGYAPTRGVERPEWTSRGRLVLDVAHLESAARLEPLVRELDLEEFRPFQLLALDRTGGLALLRWDGLELQSVSDPAAEMPLISSGVVAQEVRSFRKQVLARAARRDGLNGRVLEAFHRSHEGGPSAYSTCMHREDAQTLSFCRVAVGADSVALHYTPGSPCTTDPLPPLNLAPPSGAVSRG